jgi:hypothetical protein
MIKPFEAVDRDTSMDWTKARSRPIQAAEWTWYLDVAKILIVNLSNNAIKRCIYVLQGQAVYL